MTATVARLLEAYRQQQEAYEHVLQLAEEGVRRARAAQPLAAVLELNARKREWLSRVDALERAIAPDKRRWKEARTGGAIAARGATQSGAARELHGVLQTLTELIERILECERETDAWLLRAGADVTDASGVAAIADRAE